MTVKRIGGSEVYIIKLMFSKECVTGLKDKRTLLTQRYSHTITFVGNTYSCKARGFPFHHSFSASFFYKAAQSASSFPIIGHMTTLLQMVCCHGTQVLGISLSIHLFKFGIKVHGCNKTRFQKSTLQCTFLSPIP